MARMAKKLAVGELLSLRLAFDPMFIDNSYSIPSSLHKQVVLGCVECSAEQNKMRQQGKQ